MDVDLGHGNNNKELKLRNTKWFSAFNDYDPDECNLARLKNSINTSHLVRILNTYIGHMLFYDRKYNKNSERIKFLCQGPFTQHIKFFTLACTVIT